MPQLAFYVSPNINSLLVCGGPCRAWLTRPGDAEQQRVRSAARLLQAEVPSISDLQQTVAWWPSASAQWETLACIGRVIFRTNERTTFGLLTSLIVAFLILYIRAVKAHSWWRSFGWRWGCLQLLISIRLQQVLPLISPSLPELVIICEIIWLEWK